MNVKCRVDGCLELSNKFYNAPVYDTEFAVPLCDNHKDDFKLMDELFNMVKEDDMWKVICYACLVKWTPRTFRYIKTWTTGTMKGMKYGDLPKMCMECRVKSWNTPQVSKKLDGIAEHLMKSQIALGK